MWKFFRIYFVIRCFKGGIVFENINQSVKVDIDYWYLLNKGFVLSLYFFIFFKYKNN